MPHEIRYAGVRTPSTPVPDREQRLRVHPPYACQLVGIDPIILALAPLRPFHLPRVGHQHFMAAPRHRIPCPGGVRSHFHHDSRGGHGLEELRKVLGRGPQFSLRQFLSVQTQNTEVAPLVAEIHTHCQPVSVGARYTLLPPFAFARLCRLRLEERRGGEERSRWW